MHLLSTTPATGEDVEPAVDLGQTPGDIVVLSAADTELACLASARARLPADAFPSLRLADLKRLTHPLSVDLYLDSVASRARLVVARLLGGTGYWAYGIERLAGLCRDRDILLACLPGDARDDPALTDLSTLPEPAWRRLWAYLAEGGIDNSEHLLRYAASLLGHDTPWAEPRPLPPAALYLPGIPSPALADIRATWHAPDRPVVAVVFYRALLQSGDLAPVDALLASLADHAQDPLALAVTSLKEPAAAALAEQVLADARPDAILNLTGFAVGTPGADTPAGPLAAADCPVLQVILSGVTEDDWRASTRGLGPRDLAMNVALPEVDGRIITRAVSFKSEASPDPLTEHARIEHRPVPDRIDFTARLASAWTRLRRTPAPERRIALILANYPTRDGRIGNGVGLDTPASAVAVLNTLRDAGYALDHDFQDGDALIHALQAGPTNALTDRATRQTRVRLLLARYESWLATLPRAARDALASRWGHPASDPHVTDGAFSLALLPLGNVVLGIQPARGYNVDPAETHHSPDLVPPHGYLAFHLWLREVFSTHAIIHLGKHGNLEWLPGKALALSAQCWPEIALGPLPNLYPFIVNDPGEGTQAKRRSAAVIIDHLTPPLTRAEGHGELLDLERLLDEYHSALTLDPRRARHLESEITATTARLGLDRDLRLDDTPPDESLRRLDNHLCELKELQIRDGLHVFGSSPDGDRLTDLLVALARSPRGRGEGGQASLLRALAADLGLDDFAAHPLHPHPGPLPPTGGRGGTSRTPSPVIAGEGRGEGGGGRDSCSRTPAPPHSSPWDPLSPDLASPWTGPRPPVLASLTSAPWRTCGDTVERLELLARSLVAGAHTPAPTWTATRAVLADIAHRLRPAVLASGPAELANLLRGLAGLPVPPGPSGAPTRGRPDVLPTGRNFYSVDTRAIPTPAAWTLGWRSAALIVERYLHDHGDYPRRVALSAWGTSAMRTGGEDLAQALALMGCRPTWDPESGRVTGVEILPASVLDRPRIDVTLRISGLFRDAFPAQVELLDDAARAVAALDEPPDLNPLAASARAETARLTSEGVDPRTARRRATLRVFGSKPGAYGAGLQAPIDEGCWDTPADLAETYLSWSAHAYGRAVDGTPAPADLRRRLAATDLVLHNQDNREHDLLDSDDYYQFEGGLIAAVRHLSGAQPEAYHTDHSRPDHPRVRRLQEEIALTVRGRATNPKWIAGVLRHGYKGAFELAATVDYLFAFAATSGMVEHHHFDALFDAYLADDRVRAFMAEHNPAALRETAERFEEARRRGLWTPKRNSAPALLDDLRPPTSASTPATVATP